jgi:hypothetical protein
VSPHALRTAVEAEIERLISLLDRIDGDPDFEAEDCSGECPDDLGEAPGETFMEVAA